MTTQRDVHLFVLDTLADWEPGLAIAHLHRPAPGMASRYRVRTVGATRDPIRTLGNVAIVPDLAIAEVDPAASAMLILPGADLWADPGADDRTAGAIAAARRCLELGVPVAAICGATFGLARAGLLDDRQHTSNAPEYLAMSGYAGGARYVHAPAVEDRGLITASATAPLELARLILARLAVFSPAGLDAWYGLYRTGDPACYHAFMQAIGHGEPA